MNEAKIQNFCWQYYPGHIKAKYPIGWIDLPTFIRSTKEPKDVQTFEDITKAETLHQLYQSQRDHETAGYWKAEKARLKEYLHFFTPCVHIRPRKNRAYANIARFTGLAVLDFDHLTEEEAMQLKDHLFYSYHCIITAYLSPSKHGVKCLVSIPVVRSVPEFKQYYDAIEAEFKQYPGFDSTPNNAVLPLFRSYDPDILSRDDFDTWDIKVDPPPPPPPVNVPDTDNSTGSDERERKAILKGLKTATTNIGPPHHKRIRAIARTWGGYVPKYMSKDELIDYLNKVIDLHTYMKHNAACYKKTISSAVAVGMKDTHEIKLISGYGK